METKNKPVYKLTFSAVMVALASALSLIKIYELPLGGAVTLLSMLPIVVISISLGLKWGVGSSFVYSLIQLFFGITLDGLLGWGLTAAYLVGSIFLVYRFGLCRRICEKGLCGNACRHFACVRAALRFAPVFGRYSFRYSRKMGG